VERLPPVVPAHGGRLLELIRAVDCVLFVGRFDEPKPCGARPESVALPCALQLRPVVVERAELMDAEGGRLAESCACRLALIPCGLLFGLTPCVWALCRKDAVEDTLPACPAPTPEVFIRFCTLTEGVETWPCEFAPK
jgi:hypothetical protein